ncbi:MAG TPA: hypothetical protein PK074_11575 [Spirochaetales bacterium]|nr:hypothetical protein [Spirochaetales bacterium]HQK35357.1 hypothetical protein [Spirochaetales bacterium]
MINKKGNTGQQITLSVGEVMLNYFCVQCEDFRTFTSKGKLCCVFVNKHIISIDCILACGCGSNVQAWFLVECEDDICGQAPKVRIIKHSEKLSAMVKTKNVQYGEFSSLLDMAECAYREGLGAGAIVYLRKTFEKITAQTADVMGISYDKHEGGNPKNFRVLLEEVDKKCAIIPKEFSNNGYKLFRELSSIVHGEYNEEQGLKKFEPLRRLVIGTLENVRINRELRNAIKSLGWKEPLGGVGDE